MGEAQEGEEEEELGEELHLDLSGGRREVKEI